jgi:hypothetical protein
MLAFVVLLVPASYWLVVILGLIDGISTRYHVDSLLLADRLTFAFVALVLSAALPGFGLLGIVLETVLLIALVDISLLLRKIRGPGGWLIIERRLRSYSFSLLPAALFSFGMVYVYSSVLQTRSVSTSVAVLELGFAAFAILLVVAVVIRLTRDSQS